MPRPAYQVDTEVTLHQTATAYRTAEEAHEMSALGEFELPEGDYKITEERRNKAHWHDHDMGEGYHYRLTQDGASGWVWQHELTWAICTEWLAGIEIDICGPLEVSDSEVGWHVIGRGHFISVEDEEEGLEVMARLKAI